MSPRDAIATFLARVSLPQPRVERVSLDDAHGRVLAESIVADADYPTAARSAMDGFAVRSCDLPGTLSVVGDLSMGRAWEGRLTPRTALRIPTGGVVPDGADAVVPIEDAIFTAGSIEVASAVARGENINERASDMHAGTRVLEAGTRITAPRCAVLATLGVTIVPVFARPRIAVLPSGDELVDPNERPRIGEIRDSNRYAIAATLRALGADAVHVPTVGDAPGELEAALRTALAGTDAVVVTGGSSVGERDQTPSAIAALGEPGVIVHGLRVKPGKPTVLAAAGEKPIIGLPGNPTSSIVILQAVAAPIVARLTGGPLEPVQVSARLGTTVHSRVGWTWFVPVTLQDEGDGLVAHPLPLRSSTVSIVAQADGYAIVPEEIETYRAGTAITVARFI